MNFLKGLLSFAKTAEKKETAPKVFSTPMAIHETMMEKYGEEWITYLPETIRTSIAIDFKITPDEAMMNKILATQSTLINPNFNWDIFENVVLAFNDLVPDFRIMQVCPPYEIVWAYICIKALQPDWEPDEEIEAYIKASMVEHGLAWCPWMGYTVLNAPETVAKVKDIWKSILKRTDNPIIGTQLDRLSIIKEYVKEHEIFK